MPSAPSARQWLLIGLCWFSPACNTSEPELDACTEAANDLYQQRIEPVLTSDEPSSCNQCHLSGVDLSLFVRDTPCETMACLIERDLVNLEAPKDSTVLTWIERASPDSELITEKVIQAEYDAFYSWIEQVADCGACSEARCGEKTGGGFCASVEAEPSEAYTEEHDPGGCDDKALEEVFLETIYSTRGRCYPCHFAGTPNPPKGAIQWLVEEDNCEASSVTSMHNALENGFVNTDDPLQSLMLLKPLGPDAGGVVHGGHAKFTPDGDPAYTNFVYFLERYAACANGTE